MKDDRRRERKRKKREQRKQEQQKREQDKRQERTAATRAADSPSVRGVPGRPVSDPRRAFSGMLTIGTVTTVEVAGIRRAAVRLAANNEVLMVSSPGEVHGRGYGEGSIVEVWCDPVSRSCEIVWVCQDRWYLATPTSEHELLYQLDDLGQRLLLWFSDKAAALAYIAENHDLSAPVAPRKAAPRRGRGCRGHRYDLPPVAPRKATALNLLLIAVASGIRGCVGEVEYRLVGGNLECQVRASRGGPPVGSGEGQVVDRSALLAFLNRSEPAGNPGGEPLVYHYTSAACGRLILATGTILTTDDRTIYEGITFREGEGRVLPPHVNLTSSLHGGPMAMGREIRFGFPADTGIPLADFIRHTGIPNRFWLGFLLTPKMIGLDPLASWRVSLEPLSGWSSVERLVSRPGEPDEWEPI
jgi:hypothetical protein